MYIVFSLQCQKRKTTAKHVFVAFDFPHRIAVELCFAEFLWFFN